MTRISVALLAVATALGGAAWRVQAEAADLLEAAVEVQAMVPEGPGSEPPSLEEYRDVVAALEESIAVRRRIDDLLARVDELSLSLRERQDEAASVTEQAERQLEEIGRALGAARVAARDSGEQLLGLRVRLGHTGRLARAIAEELEDLDRRLGPSVGVIP